jgi:photosystem II stability/assembly factor-like uncharacterized protein
MPRYGLLASCVLALLLAVPAGLGVRVSTAEGIDRAGYPGPDAASRTGAIAERPLANAAGFWTARGLSGYDVVALAPDPSGQATVYAGTDAQGAYKSTDGGRSWTRMSGLPSNLAEVFALAVNPVNRHVVYAGGGLYKSSDGGTTWTDMSNGLTSDNTWALAVDPLRPRTVYAGTGGGVFKSTNGAASWTWVSGVNIGFVRSLQIDPANPRTVYAGTDSLFGSGVAGVYKTTNGGKMWVDTLPLPDGYVVYGLSVDPLDTATIYAAVAGKDNGQGGVYKSTNSGKTWALMVNGITQVHMFAVVADPLVAGTVYAGSRYYGSPGTAYKSTDGGLHWTAISDGLAGTSVFTLATTAGGSRIYAGTDTGAFSTSDRQ